MSLMRRMASALTEMGVYVPAGSAPDGRRWRPVGQW
jgi:hypothetical protein